MKMMELTRGRIKQVQPAFGTYPDVPLLVLIDALCIISR